MTNSRLVKRLVSLVINYKKHRGLSKLDTVEQKGEYQVFSIILCYHGITVVWVGIIIFYYLRSVRIIGTMSTATSSWNKKTCWTATTVSEDKLKAYTVQQYAQLNNSTKSHHRRNIDHEDDNNNNNNPQLAIEEKKKIQIWRLVELLYHYSDGRWLLLEHPRRHWEVVHHLLCLHMQESQHHPNRWVKYSF